MSASKSKQALERHLVDRNLDPKAGGIAFTRGETDDTQRRSPACRTCRVVRRMVCV
ncbi:hypothetical protein PCAR4_930021 [Paraburkholderia caribensis]|nr:hypothetical protein PCAR4_930021 [Paraburkholderia caribensis]